MSDPTSLKFDSPQHVIRLFITQSPKGLLSIGKSKVKKILCISESNIHVYDFNKLELDTILPLDSIIDWKLGTLNVGDGQKCEVTIFYTVKGVGKASGKKNSFVFTCWEVPTLLTILSSRMAWIRGLTQTDTSFFVRKLKKSKEHVEYTLKFYGARIYKFDNTTNQPLGYIDMKDITSINLVREKPEALVLVSSRFKVHYYTTNNVKAMLLSIQNHMKQLLGSDQCSVLERTSQEISNLMDFQKILNDSGDNIFPCEHKVERLKKRLGAEKDSSGRGKIQHKQRILQLNASFVVEINDQKLISSLHRTSDIVSLIRPIDNDKEFSIVFSDGEVKTYVTNKRDATLLNILEMKRKGKADEVESDEISSVIPVAALLDTLHFDISRAGMKEGIENSVPHPSYSEFLMKKINERQNSLEFVIPLLHEFNISFSSGEVPCKDKKFLATVFSVLKLCLQGEVSENSIATVLLTLSKCLSCKVLFDELASVKANFQDLVMNSCFKKMDSTTVRFLATAIMIQAATSEKNLTFVLGRENIDSLLAHMTTQVKDPRDCISVHNILCLFSMLLHSTSPTLRDNSNHLLARLFEPQITSHLFLLCRHDAMSVMLLSTSLLSTMLFVSSGLQYELLQKEILTSGLLIKSVYTSLFSKDFDARECTKKFIDLSVSHYKEAENVMEKIIPKQIISSVPAAPVVLTPDKREVKKSTKNANSKVAVPKEGFNPDGKYNGWYEALSAMHNDIASVACIWNDQTRQDLEESLLSQIRALNEAEMLYANSGEKFVWHYEEYETDLKSLQPYEKVNQYFLGYLDSSESSKMVDIEDPEALVKELYYKMVLTDDNSSRMQYIRALSRVYLSNLSRKNVPFPHLDNLVKILSAEIYPQEVIMEMIGLVHAIMTVDVNRSLINQYCVPMLVHFVRKIHCSTTHNLRAAKICLNVLKNLSTFRVKSLDEGQVVWPLPIAVREMTNNDSLPHIIQCILSATPILKRTTLQLIMNLVSIDKKVIPSIYQTGIYYFIFASLDGKVSEENEKSEEVAVKNTASDDFFISLEAVKLLQATCVSQSFSPESVNLKKGESFMNLMLPNSIIRMMLVLGPEAFQKLFNSNVNSESVIWNNSMRCYLQKCAREHIKDFLSELKEKEGAVVYKHNPIPRIIYKELVNQPFAAGYYLKNVTPQFISTLPPRECVRFFWSIIEVFGKVELHHHLIYFIRPQRDILKIREGLFTENPYPAFEKLLSALKIKDKIDIPLLEAATELLTYITKDYQNIHGAMESNVPRVLSDLLLPVLDYRDGISRIDPEGVKTMAVCDNILSSVFEFLTRVSTSPFVVSILESVPNITSLTMRCLYSMESRINLKVVTDFISTLVRAENLDFISKLWNSGFPILAMNLMMYRPSKDESEEAKNTNFAKAGLVTVPLAIMLFTSYKLYPERDNFILRDLNSILPFEVIYQLKLLGSKQNEKVKDVIELLHADLEEPGMVWTKKMRKQLHSYVSKTVGDMSENKFQKKVPVMFIDYEERRMYLCIGNVFVDIYIDKKWESWHPRDCKFFASELLEFLSSPLVRKVNHVRIVITACLALLDRTLKQNRNLFNEMVAHSFATDNGISYLFNLLKLKKDVIEEVSFVNILQLLTLCFESTIFSEKLTTTSISNLHNLVYAFEYANATNSALIKQILEFLKKNCLQGVIRKEIEKDGVLLYLLLIFCGGVKCSNDDDRREAIRILITLAQAAYSEGEEKYDGNSYSTLQSLFPSPIADMFISASATDILTYYESNHKQPNIVWGKETRKEICAYLEKQMDYMRSNKQWSISKDFKLEYNVHQGLIIGDIYIRLYNENPDFHLPHPEQFLTSVVQTLMTCRDTDIIQDLLLSLRNVLDFSKANDKNLASHPELNNIAPNLILLVGDSNSTLAISSLSLQLMYEIVSGNKAFLQEWANDVSLFIKGFSSLPDLQELYLVVFLAIAHQDEYYVDLLLNNGIEKVCVEIMESRKGSSIALRAAQLIKYMASSPSYGAQVETFLTEGHSEIWEEYREIQLPPPNMPLAESLRSISNLSRSL